MEKLIRLSMLLGIMGIVFLKSSPSYATHAAGADLTYECLGGNLYQFTLALYRDCGGVNMNNNYNMTLRANNCQGNQTHDFTLRLDRVSIIEVTPTCPGQNSNCTGGNVTGIQEHIYTATVTLPDQCSDWRFLYCLPARNNIINTIQNPGNQDLCVSATLNNIAAPCNSSPRFSNKPVSFLCTGTPFCFNHGASDVNGDSLIYTVITPMNTINGGTVNYVGGFSVNNPVNTDPEYPFSVNNLNGNICFTPAMQVVSVLAMRVEEYRGGQLIGSVVRDIQINVTNCNNTNPTLFGLDGNPILPDGSNTQVNACTNENLNLLIQANDPDPGQQLTMVWNGGLPGGAFVDNGDGTANLNWNVPTQAAGMTLCFTVSAYDDYCPYIGSYTSSYCVTINQETVLTTGDSVAICGTREVELDVIGGNQFSWSVIEGDPIVVGTNFSCNPCPNPVARPAFTTKYMVESDNALCNNIDSITVHVMDNVGNVNASASVGQSPLCEDLCTTLNGVGEISDTIVSQKSFTAEPNAQITHLNNTSSTINVNGLDVGTVGPEVIQSICMNISHDYDSDLIITLTCPDGTQILLSDQNGGNGRHYRTTCFTAGATVPVTSGFAPFNGDFIPEQGDLNQILSGCNTNGNWTLTVQDVKNGHNGWLVDWSIVFTDTVINNTPVTAGIWEGPGFYGTGLSESICPSQSAWYSFTVIDEDECFMKDSVYLEMQPALDIEAIVTHENCIRDNGEITTEVNNAVGNLDYTWTPNVGNTNVVSNLQAGNYQLYVEDDSGADCSLDTSFTVLHIDNQPVLDTFILVNESCYMADDGAITFSISNGNLPYNFMIDGPVTVENTTGEFSNLPPGVYTYEIMDSIACHLTGTFEVLPGIRLMLDTEITSAACSDTNGIIVLHVDGGTTYEYSINNGTTFQTGNTFENLYAGAYQIRVNDESGCYIDTLLNLNNDPAQVIEQINITPVTCFNGNDGQIQIIASGGTGTILYSIDNGNTTQTGNTFVGLAKGTYNVWTQDENECLTLRLINVTQPQQIKAQITLTKPLCYGDCNGEIAVNQITGGNGTYTTEIGGISQITHQYTGICAGQDTVIISDHRGCENRFAFQMQQPDTLNLSLTAKATTCFEGADGTLTASVNGGTKPYLYDWSNGGASPKIFNLTAGNYQLTVTDANGCQFDGNADVLQPGPVQISGINKNDEFCFNACDGRIIIHGPETVSYSINGGNTMSANNIFTKLCPGNYPIRVANQFGCTTDTLVEILAAPQFTVEASNDTTICIGGSVNLEAQTNGGTGTPTVEWMDTRTRTVIPQNPVQVSPVISTTYLAIAEDENGCINTSKMVMVNVHAPIKISGLSDTEICAGETVTLSAVITGGNGDYQYTWRGSDGSEYQGAEVVISPENNTTYRLTVEDGCETPAGQNRATVVVNPLPVVNFAPDAYTGCIPQVINFNNMTDIEGKYHWNFGDGNISSFKNPSHTYTERGCFDISLIVTSYKGCQADTSFEELICVLPYPFADFSYSPNGEINASNPLVTFTNHSLGAENYEWIFNSGAGYFYTEHAQYLFPENRSGTYPVQLVAENEFGCRDTAFQSITVKQDVLVFVPNAFTPNGDQVNNVFQPTLKGGFNPYDYELTIYNRWGEVVFVSQNAEIGWDGNFRGEKAQDGVYVWTIEFKELNSSKKHRMEGHVTLLK